MKKHTIQGPLFIVIAASLWAVDGIIRRNLYVLSPLVIVFFEHFVGALLLSPLVIRKLPHEKLSRKEWGAVGVVALLSSVLGTLWFTSALLMTNYISFSVVFLIQKLQPLFAVVTARIVLKEKLSKQYAIWAAVALIAAYFVTFPTGIVNFNTGDKTTLAALFALGSAAAWGSTTAFSRYTLLRHDDKFITGIRFIIATLMALTAIIFMGQQSSLMTLTWPQAFQFIFIALSTGMVAMLIYYKGLKTTSVHIATILELTFPLLAVAIDYVVYKKVLSLTQIGAGCILLFAMYTISRIQKK